MRTHPPLILASSSPRRLDLLRSCGVELAVEEPGVEEGPAAGEDARGYVLRVAREKALAVAGRRPGAIVLAADTEVVLDGEVLGKPADPGSARAMLQRLAGRAHHVITAVCLVGPRGEKTFAVESQVRIEATAAQLDWYVASGEPMGKAGAYAIQGRGASLVTSVEGSYSGVVGLPLAQTLAALARAGARLPWDPDGGGRAEGSA